MAHVEDVRWRSGATPEGAYRARLYQDHEGKRAAIIEAATDNKGPSPVNAASSALRDKVRALWSPPADRVLVAQSPEVASSNCFDEIDEYGDPSNLVPAELVERWTPLSE